HEPPQRALPPAWAEREFLSSSALNRAPACACLTLWLAVFRIHHVRLHLRGDDGDCGVIDKCVVQVPVQEVEAGSRKIGRFELAMDEGVIGGERNIAARDYLAAKADHVEPQFGSLE